MHQSVPRKWVELLEISRDRLLPKGIRLLPLDSALDMLGLDQLELTRTQALEALQFWDDLGHLRLHTGSATSFLVTDVPWLIKLLGPLVHHDIKGSLQKACSGSEALNNCDLAVAGPRCKGLAEPDRELLLKMAGELQDLGIVRQKLLPYLTHWGELETGENTNAALAALKILESCLLVAQY